MIKIFQLLIHQVLDSVELNEKTFRDRGSGFVVVQLILRTNRGRIEHIHLQVTQIKPTKYESV